MELPGRGFLVTFEGDHRAMLYPGSLAEPSPPAGIPGPFPSPPSIATQHDGSGSFLGSYIVQKVVRR